VDLSKISVQVRPRNPYEAVDLGFVMARQWLKPLLLLWLIPALPVICLSYALFFNQPLWSLLLVWWLKPLFESIQLRYISEKLFDDNARWQDTLKQTFNIALHQWFSKLVLQRLSLSRSLNMPVGELEQLHGQRRSQRLATLHRGAGSSGLWLTVVGNSLESLFIIAIFSLAWMFIPMEMDIDFDLDMLLSSPMLFPTITWAGFVAMALASPFYVCGGFMLYINRRTWLEAWDIELTFRQLSNDHLAKGSKAIGLVLAAFLTLSLTTAPQPAQAELSRDETQQMIFDILEGDEFHQMREDAGWRWKDTPTPEADEDMESFWSKLGKWVVDFLEGTQFLGDISPYATMIISVLEVLMWGLVIAVFAYLIYRFRHLRVPDINAIRKEHPAPPSHLFGLELNQDTLPADVIAAAQSLWQQQQFRQALSLLYRAALTFLVHERHLPLNSSHTEQECLRLCLQQEPQQRGHFFQRLTGHWINLAYAHNHISDDEFANLCSTWPSFFDDSSTGGSSS